MPTPFTLPDPLTLGRQQAQYTTEALGQYPGMRTIEEQLSGKLPSDVLSNLYQTGAEAGFRTGAPGGAASNAATLRALGLTSLGMQQQGLKNLNEAYGTFGKLDPLGISQQKLELEKQARDEEFKTHLTQMGIDAERANLLTKIDADLRLKGLDIQSANYRSELQAQLQREGYSAAEAARLAAANQQAQQNLAYQNWLRGQVGGGGTTTGTTGTTGTPGGTPTDWTTYLTGGGASTDWMQYLGIPSAGGVDTSYLNLFGDAGLDYDIFFGDEYGTPDYSGVDYENQDYDAAWQDLFWDYSE